MSSVRRKYAEFYCPLALFFAASFLVLGEMSSFSFAENVTTSETTSERVSSVPISTISVAMQDNQITGDVPATKSFKESDYYPAILVETIQHLSSSNAPETESLKNWSDDVLQTVVELIQFYEEENFEEVTRSLRQLERFTIALASFRRHWNPSLKSDSDEAKRDDPANYVPSATALEELQLALERRILLWRCALLTSSSPSLSLARHFSKGQEDVQRLREKTQIVENFFLEKGIASSSTNHRPNNKQELYEFGLMWCEYLDTTSFLTELEACEKRIPQLNRRVSTLISTIPVSMLVSFSDRANVILARLNDQEMTESQLNYLNHPVIADWKTELLRWTADTVPPKTLLRDVEQYEAFGGMSDMQSLFRSATRLSFSPTPAFRQLGGMTLDLYGGSNIKIYVSNILVNHLLPTSESESASFRDTIQGQTVYGRRQTSTNVEMNFEPNENRLLLSLDIKGDIATSSRSNAFATTLFNRGQATYTARKRIELTEEGFVLAPSEVRVDSNRIELRNVQTEFDGVPLLSGLVRGVVKNQYEARESGAKEETRQKIFRQVKSRVDKEAETRFSAFNERFSEFISHSQNEFDLSLEKKNALTEEHWLLTSWALRSQDTLSGNTPAPETLPGAFADFKIHESVLNTMIGKLKLDGKKGTVADFRKELSGKFNRPEIDEPGENDDVSITFAAYNPVVVRFVDGQILISISIESLKLQRQVFKDFRVQVRYRPVLTPDNKMVLQRDGVINLIDARSQIVLRTVFGKIFPVSRPIPLSPKLLEEDERFAGLKTGQCRIEKGWFALALVADDSAPLTSEHLPQLRFAR
ncbi:MAG: hypothetical protein ACRCUY_01280 [Thermoguttaceae bacterium]